MLIRCLLVAAAGAALTAPLPAQGLRPEWEIRDLVLSLATKMDAVQSALARMDPAAWTGAPGAYAEQHAAAGRELGYAHTNAGEVATAPTGLGKSFELHLRLAAIEQMVISVAAGSRNYQDPQPAEDALQALSEMADARTQLRQYLMELAASKEQQLSTIDAEAQRCRAELLKAPPPPKPTPRRTRTRSEQ